MTEQTDLHTSSDTVENVSVQTEQPQDPYADVTLPENSLLGPEGLATFKQVANQVNLPAKALTQWLLWEENRLQATAKQAEKIQQEQQANWVRQTQEQFGPQWQAEVSKAVRAADAFGGAQLRQLLEETGLGNHPVMVRTFHAVAQHICEDVTPGGTSSVTTDKTFTQALYGKN